MTFLTNQNDALEKVILVDSDNNAIGLKDKILAHVNGDLHRGFSVFIFNKKNELLIQRRSATKYHSPNEWANTCCGHPRENESNSKASNRRLTEEMGISTSLTEGVEFIYRAELTNNLIEHEYIQFFTGKIEGEPEINPFEVSDYLWISKSNLFENTKHLVFGPWFTIYLNKYQKVLNAMFETKL